MSSPRSVGLLLLLLQLQMKTASSSSSSPAEQLLFLKCKLFCMFQTLPMLPCRIFSALPIRASILSVGRRIDANPTLREGEELHICRKVSRRRLLTLWDLLWELSSPEANVHLQSETLLKIYPCALTYLTLCGSALQLNIQHYLITFLF